MQSILRQRENLTDLCIFPKERINSPSDGEYFACFVRQRIKLNLKHVVYSPSDGENMTLLKCKVFSAIWRILCMFFPPEKLKT